MRRDELTNERTDTTPENMRLERAQADSESDCHGNDPDERSFIFERIVKTAPSIINMADCPLLACFMLLRVWVNGVGVFTSKFRHFLLGVKAIIRLRLFIDLKIISNVDSEFEKGERGRRTEGEK